jgi:hypothetical protein
MNRLLDEERKEVFDSLVAFVAGLLFLGLTALVLWPIGKARMALFYAEGYGLLWLGLGVTSLLLFVFRRVLRIDMYSHFDVYVISALIVSSFWQLCWSSFTAAVLQRYAADTSWLDFTLLYVIGLVSCFVAFLELSVFYQGSIYRIVNVPLGLVSFVLFCIWPRLGQVLFGWLWASLLG